MPPKKGRRGFPRRPHASGQRPYAHFGSPSLLAGASAVEPTYTEHVFVVVVCVTLAVNPSAVTVIVGPTTPVVVAYAVPRLLVYFTESAKYASSAVIKLRRSDFIEARYAFSFVFANFGIAIAARMPMITTTIRSSINVKPLRFILVHSFLLFRLGHGEGRAFGPSQKSFRHTKKNAAGITPRRIRASGQWPYTHFGSPSLLAGANEVVPTYTAHVFVVVVCDTVAVNPLAVTAMVGPTTPLVVLYAVPRLFVYFTESAKYASSAVIRLRRSDFIDARYAFSFVLANFGIAIAAKMPMITTTITSSISVKPLRFIWTTSRVGLKCGSPNLFRAPPVVPASLEAQNVPLMNGKCVT